MKFWKRIAVAGMATIAALSLAACGSKSSSSSTSTSNSYTPKSLNIQFYHQAMPIQSKQKQNLWLVC